MNTLLEQLKNKQLVWSANRSTEACVSNTTGYSALDDALQGGFPTQGVIDIETPVGIGELRVLLPTLCARQQQHQGLLVLIAPPMSINSEALAAAGFPIEKIIIVKPNSPEQNLWSAEQCLKSGCCDSVILWHQDLEVAQAKRLTLAAEKGSALSILLRQSEQFSIRLPVNLALKFAAHEQGIRAHITKRKGGWPSSAFTIDMVTKWPQLTLRPQSTNVVRFPHSKVG